jgi:hypothetical protein
MSGFWSDRRGTSAVEFAFVAPVLVALAVGSMEGGLLTHRYYDMEAAVASGAQYVMRGGSDMSVAQAVILSGWTTKSDNAQVKLTQSCRCASTAAACGGLCPDLTSPHGFISIAASETYSGLFITHDLAASETIRVR